MKFSIDRFLTGFLGRRKKKVYKPEVEELPKKVDRVAKEKVYKPKYKPEIDKSKTIIDQAEQKAKEIVIEAREEAANIRLQAEQAARQAEKKTLTIQDDLRTKEADIARRTGALEEQKKHLEQTEKNYQQKLAEIEKLKQQQLEKLEQLAGLTSTEARQLILDALEKRLKNEMGKRIREAEESAKIEADDKARQVLVDAIYHGATDYVAEYTVSTVKLPEEDMKGRIIGKEGRNIRAFEKVTGVDLELDESPDYIRISCFDPVRREIAKVAMQKLIADGRIQPSRIEEIVEKTKNDTDKLMHEAGETLCHSLKVYHLPKEVIDMLGRLKYRFSYGQNMISHTLEETKIGIALAYNVGANVNIVRLGCLLHDIGKVIIEEEGSHVQLGADFLKKHKMPQEVIDCVAEHHEDKPFSSVESTLVYIADAISGARPGARVEDYGEYVKRLQSLEEVAQSFNGVASAYAIQAGREVRVIVNPEKLDDEATFKLADDITQKIEKELTFPGQVKVTVLRELRAQKVAKK